MAGNAFASILLNIFVTILTNANPLTNGTSLGGDRKTLPINLSVDAPRKRAGGTAPVVGSQPAAGTAGREHGSGVARLVR